MVLKGIQLVSACKAKSYIGMWLLSGKARQGPTPLCLNPYNIIRDSNEWLVFLFIVAHYNTQIHIPASDFVLKGAQLGRHTH